MSNIYLILIFFLKKKKKKKKREDVMSVLIARRYPFQRSDLRYTTFAFSIKADEHPPMT